MERRGELERMVAPLLIWYEKNKKDLPWRTEATPYHVWLSEIMLQQTRTTAVIPYYERFICEFPSVSALAEVPDDALMKLWEGLGYYSRARNLKKAARILMEDYGGRLPDTAEALRTLPGIGDYTAGAIASIAFGRPEPETSCAPLCALPDVRTISPPLRQKNGWRKRCGKSIRRDATQGISRRRLWSWGKMCVFQTGLRNAAPVRFGRCAKRGFPDGRRCFR